MSDLKILFFLYFIKDYKNILKLDLIGTNFIFKLYFIEDYKIFCSSCNIMVE